MPIVVRLAVASSAGDPDHLAVECTHNRLVPSLADPCKCPLAVDRDTEDARSSVALDVFGGDECGIGAAIRSWSSEVAHQISVRGCSSVVQVRGWVRSASEVTGEVHCDCYWRKQSWGEG